jgi:hypothetical protein
MNQKLILSLAIIMQTMRATANPIEIIKCKIIRTLLTLLNFLM